jgi:predicted dehydrogenase
MQKLRVGLVGAGFVGQAKHAPDPFHPELAGTAVEAALHVLCEEPLALTVGGCNSIAAGPPHDIELLTSVLRRAIT